MFLEVSLTRRARASERGERRKRRKRSARLDEISKTSRRYLDQKSALFSLLFFSLSSFVNFLVSFFCERTDKTETDRETDRETEGRISKKNNCSKSSARKKSVQTRENFRTRKLALRALCLPSSEREREREREKKKKRRRRTTTTSEKRSFVVLPRFLLLDSFEYLLKREEEEEKQSLVVREIHQHDRRSAKRTTRGRGEECD